MLEFASHSIWLQLSGGRRMLTIYSDGGTDAHSFEIDRGDKENCSVSHMRVYICYRVLDGAFVPRLGIYTIKGTIVCRYQGFSILVEGSSLL